MPTTNEDRAEILKEHRMMDGTTVRAVRFLRASHRGPVWLVVFERAHEDGRRRVLECRTDQGAAFDGIAFEAGDERLSFERPRLVHDPERLAAIGRLARRPTRYPGHHPTKYAANDYCQRWITRDDNARARTDAVSRRFRIEKTAALHGGGLLALLSFTLDARANLWSTGVDQWWLTLRQEAPGAAFTHLWLERHPWRERQAEELGGARLDIDPAALRAALDAGDAAALTALLAGIPEDLFGYPDAAGQAFALCDEQDRRARMRDDPKIVDLAAAPSGADEKAARGGRPRVWASDAERKRAERARLARDGIVFLTIAVPAERADEFKRSAAQACDEHRAVRPARPAMVRRLRDEADSDPPDAP